LTANASERIAGKSRANRPNFYEPRATLQRVNIPQDAGALCAMGGTPQRASEAE